MLDAFFTRGNNNPDGWGVAIYADRSARVFKEARAACESDLADFLTHSDLAHGRILIAHLRKASVGARAYHNTHPFLRELNGTEYVLAHNGTLRFKDPDAGLTRSQPVGNTDSERLLCHLLRSLESRRDLEWNSATFRWLYSELLLLNDRGTLNCTFSDGSRCFCYHDRNGYNSLQFIEYKAPFGKVMFNGHRNRVDLSEIYPPTAHGVLIATHPLTDEAWTSFAPGQLLVFSAGTILFDSRAKDEEP